MVDPVPDHEVVPVRRPRVAGDRESAILQATVRVLADVGYDRLTMDQVATAARAGKATLYRRWSSKAELVVDAVVRAQQMPRPQHGDTDSLRADLFARMCGEDGWGEELPMSVMAALVTALNSDPELFELWRERFLEPRMRDNREVFERARGRGEVHADADLDLLASLLPAMCSFRGHVVGLPVDRDFVATVIDQILLPAALGRGAGSADTREPYVRPVTQSERSGPNPDEEVP